MNETTLTMAKQINAKELKFARFTLTCDDKKNQLGVIKGKKGINITYNSGTDLYDLEFVKIKNYERIVEKNLTGVYAEDLQGLIQDYFPRFEYVMDSIRIVGVNC